jgi:hypothetical protein
MDIKVFIKNFLVAFGLLSLISGSIHWAVGNGFWYSTPVILTVRLVLSAIISYKWTLESDNGNIDNGNI